MSVLTTEQARSFLRTASHSPQACIFAVALTTGMRPKQLGHTSVAFTLDVYSHVLPHMQDDAAAKVEAALMSV